MSKDTQEENSWLIDLILSFFHSAEWKVPILSFIEDKCIVFDDEEENKLEYTVIHKDFKKLAEGLIENMLQELGANSEMFGEAYEKAKDTPGYQKITKIIQSIDNYQIFASMMRKKNSSLNEAAFRILHKQDQEIVTPTGSSAVLPGPETKIEPAIKQQTKQERKKELQEKKELGRLDTVENTELTNLEQEQIELLKSISIREEEERRKIEEEEDEILKQVLELSSKEHAEEIKKKQFNFEEQERKLKEKEEQLRREDERIKKEKEQIKLAHEKIRKKENKIINTAAPATFNPELIKPVETVTTAAPAVSESLGLSKEKLKKKKTKEVAEEDSDSRKKNKKILKQEPKETTQIKRDYDLPPVMEQKHSNAGMRAADLDILKAATNDLFKKQRDTYDPYSDFDPSYDPLKPMKAEEGKSLRELMKEKMEKMEKVESVDDRKTRLKAQRDLLIKQKQDVRQTELNRCPSLNKKAIKEARDGKSTNEYSNNLFKDLLALDKKVNLQEQKKRNTTVNENKEERENLKDDEDQEAQVIQTRAVKKDMKSLFEDSDEETEAKKIKDEKARLERHRKIIKNLTEEGDS